MPRGEHPNSREGLAAGRQRSHEARHRAALERWAARRTDLERMAPTMSQTAIALHYGVSQRLVGMWLRKFSIPARSKSNVGPANGRYKDGSQSRLYRKAVEKVECADCGTKRNLGIHHKNGDHFDDRRENLQVLCNRCHLRLEATEMWLARREGRPARSNAPINWKPGSGGASYRRKKRHAAV